MGRSVSREDNKEKLRRRKSRESSVVKVDADISVKKESIPRCEAEYWLGRTLIAEAEAHSSRVSALQSSQQVGSKKSFDRERPESSLHFHAKAGRGALTEALGHLQAASSPGCPSTEAAAKSALSLVEAAL